METKESATIYVMPDLLNSWLIGQAIAMPMAAIDAAGSGTGPATFVEQMVETASAFETGLDSAIPRAPREAVLGSLALMVGGMILAHAAKRAALSGEILQAAKGFGDTAIRGLA